VIFLFLVIGSFVVFQQPLDGVDTGLSGSTKTENKSAEPEDLVVEFEFKGEPGPEDFVLMRQDCREFYSETGEADESVVKDRIGPLDTRMEIKDYAEDARYRLCAENREGAVIESTDFSISGGGGEPAFKQSGFGGDKTLDFKIYNFGKLVDDRDYRVVLEEVRAK
jgi:hypothetical protein